MACTDPKRREFMNIPVNSTYELSVNGPAGFATFAHFDREDTDDIETWPFEDISPGPKKKRLTGAGQVHVVFVFVNLAKEIAVEVKASVNGKQYCRTVRGKGTEEIIVHTLRMA
jgi:hypothetical protein